MHQKDISERVLQAHRASPILVSIYREILSQQIYHDDSGQVPRFHHDVPLASGCPRTDMTMLSPKKSYHDMRSLALSPSQYLSILSFPTVQK